MTSRALVTGATGFVGRHFVSHLRHHGWQVEGMDVHLPGGQTVWPDIEQWDVRNRFTRPASTLRHEDPYDLVIHCAAVVGGRAKIEGEPLAVAANLEIDAAMFRWATVTRPGRIVYFSSSAAYPVGLQTSAGKLDERMINLDEPWLPDEVYGWAKLTGEMLARRAREAGLAVTVVRPFSGYGSDQDETYPFRAFVERARRRDNPFEVWGDGNQTRDFIHIDDIVNATMRLVNRRIDGPLNLGTGRPVNMTALAKLVCNIAGYAPVIRYVPNAPRGVQYRVANVERLRRVYQPSVSLEQGILRALA